MYNAQIYSIPLSDRAIYPPFSVSAPSPSTRDLAAAKKKRKKKTKEKERKKNGEKKKREQKYNRGER